MELRRKFDNVPVKFDDGTELTIGFWSDGEKSALKLRIPESGWKLTQLFQPTSITSDKPAILVLEKNS